MLLLIASIALMLLVVLGGWSLLTGGATWGVISLLIVLIYVILTIMVGRWSRGAVTLSVVFAVLMLIFSSIGFESWFARDKADFAEAALPSDLVGLLVFLMIPVQIALGIVASIAVKQEWHVEEERPIGSGGGSSDAAAETSGTASPSAA